MFGCLSPSSKIALQGRGLGIKRFPATVEIMKWTDDWLDILQNLGFSVVEVWRRNREMSDYSALRAYEAAFLFYRAETRGQTPNPPELNGLDADVFHAVRGICEFRLGRGECPIEGREKVPAVPLEQIVDCLRELSKSVQRHTRIGGRQGYLTFIDGFLP